MFTNGISAKPYDVPWIYVEMINYSCPKLSAGVVITYLCPKLNKGIGCADSLTVLGLVYKWCCPIAMHRSYT